METLAVMTPVRKFTGCLFPAAFCLCGMGFSVPFLPSASSCKFLSREEVPELLWLGTKEELKSRMCLSNPSDYSQSHSFSSLLNLIPPLRCFQAILALLLSVPSLQWEGCHEQPANSVVPKGGDTLLVAFRSRAEFHCYAGCASDDFLMLNCQVAGGISAVLLFKFFKIIVIFILSFWLFCKQECIKGRWRMWRSSTIEIKGTKFYQQSQQISDLLKWSQLLYYCLLLHYAQ